MAREADMQLQFATYFDASDQASLSRIYGGIHPPADDFPGRRIGHIVGPQTPGQSALQYFNRPRARAVEPSAAGPWSNREQPLVDAATARFGRLAGRNFLLIRKKVLDNLRMRG